MGLSTSDGGMTSGMFVGVVEAESEKGTVVKADSDQFTVIGMIAENSITGSVLVVAGGIVDVVSPVASVEEFCCVRIDGVDGGVVSPLVLTWLEAGCDGLTRSAVTLSTVSLNLVLST